MSELRTAKGGFSGHETFPFRYTWLPKAAKAVSEDPGLLSRPVEAMVVLGVGKNMVSSIRHWGLVAGILAEEAIPDSPRGRRPKVTDFGERLFLTPGWDPFLEDPATPWLLHWNVATNRQKATTWFWAFNYLPQPEFSKADLFRWLYALTRERAWMGVPESTLRRDIDCFIKTYVSSRPTRLTPIEDTLDCPLVDLGLVRELGSAGHFILTRGEQPSLPDEVVVYALVDFLERSEVPARTVPLDAIAFAPGSPGRVFCLSEEALMARMERLAQLTRNAIVFDETAGLRQLIVHKLPDRLGLLDRYFNEVKGTSPAQIVHGGR